MGSETFEPPVEEKKSAKPKGRPKKQSKADLARARRQERLDGKKRAGASKGQRLWAPEIAGLHMYWAVDEGARLDLMQDEGYYFADKADHPELKQVLSSDTGSKISQVVSGKNGKPTRQYLMLQPLDITEEVNSEKMERLRKRDAGLVAVDQSQGIGKERTTSGKSAVYAPEGSQFKV